jgi:hypothetical protein
MSKGDPDYNQSTNQALDVWRRLYNETPNVGADDAVQKLHNMYSNQSYLTGLTGSTLGRAAESDAITKALSDERFRQAQALFPSTIQMAQANTQPSALENIGSLLGTGLGIAFSPVTSGASFLGNTLLGNLLGANKASYNPNYNSNYTGYNLVPSSQNTPGYYDINYDFYRKYYG